MCSVKGALAAIAGSSKDRTAFMAANGIPEVMGQKRGRRGQPLSESTKNKSAIAAFVLNAYNASGKPDTHFVKETKVVWR